MRRFAAIALLLLLLLTTGGHALLFCLRLVEVRQAMRTALSRGEYPGGIEALTFSVSEASRLNWLEEQHEFEWKGNLYDVVATRKEKGSVTYYAVADHRESALVSQYSKDNERPSPAKALQHLLSLPYLLPVADITAPVSIRKSELRVAFECLLPPAENDVADPPPWKQLIT